MACCQTTVSQQQRHRTVHGHRASGSMCPCQRSEKAPKFPENEHPPYQLRERATIVEERRQGSALYRLDSPQIGTVRGVNQVLRSRMAHLQLHPAKLAEPSTRRSAAGPVVYD